MSTSLWVPPALATALLLLATGSSWRMHRGWFEAVGLGAGVAILNFAFEGLPPSIVRAVLPSASLLVVLLVFANCEWRFAPDRGQTGFAWALQAALRPTLGAALGAAAGYWPIVFLSHSPFLPLLCPLTLITGLIVAHALDQVLCADTPLPLSDDDGGDQPPARRHAATPT